MEHFTYLGTTNLSPAQKHRVKIGEKNCGSFKGQKKRFQKEKNHMQSWKRKPQGSHTGRGKGGTLEIQKKKGGSRVEWEEP